MEEFYTSPPSSPLPGAPKKKLIDVCGKTSSQNLIHSMSESDDEEEINYLGFTSSVLPNDSTKSTTSFNPSWDPPNKRKELFHEKKTKQSSGNKAALQERVKRMKPGECSKFITTIMSKEIMKYDWGSSAFEILREICLYNLRVGDTIINEACVSWEQAIPSNLTEKETVEHLLICWPCEQFIDMVKGQTLLSTLMRYKSIYSTYRFYLVVFSLDNYMKSFGKTSCKYKNKDGTTVINKQKSNFNVERERVQRAMVEMELKTGMSVIGVNSPRDLAELIEQLTKIVSELPYRAVISKIEDKVKWHMRGESKGCVRVDKQLNGLQQLWVQQLYQFNFTNLDTAKSIAEIYPSPYSLFEAYNSCYSKVSKEMLLQDICVKKRQNAAGKGRVGPELSKKLYILFNEEEDKIVG